MIKPAVVALSILTSLYATCLLWQVQNQNRTEPKPLWITFLVWFHLEWRQSCLWTKERVFAHDLLVLGMASQPPPSATPLSTHAVQIKLIELFQSYITITKRRRWPFDDFYRLHWNVGIWYFHRYLSFKCLWFLLLFNSVYSFMRLRIKIMQAPLFSWYSSCRPAGQ